VFGVNDGGNRQLQKEKARNLLQIGWDHIILQGIWIFFTANLFTCTVREDALMLCQFRFRTPKNWLLTVLVSTCLVSTSTSMTLTGSRPLNYCDNSRIGHTKTSVVSQESLFYKKFNPKCVTSVLPSQKLNLSRINAQIWFQNFQLWGKLCHGKSKSHGKIKEREWTICKSNVLFVHERTDNPQFLPCWPILSSSIRQILLQQLLAMHYHDDSILIQSLEHPTSRALLWGPVQKRL
jgi:hypothetical protein